MFKMRQILGSLHRKVQKLLFMVIFCLVMVSVVTPKYTVNKASSITEEALVDFALDHNQCLGEGHGPDTFGYNQCMEKLNIQRRSIVRI